MKINKVTMTGADNSIQPEDLFEISKKYPFVEWGILVSRNSQGKNRFPSLEWMNYLSKLNRNWIQDGNEGLQLACHVCGTYVKEVLMGGHRFTIEIGELWNDFQRMQINTHGVKHQYDPKAIEFLKDMDKEIIFQFDGANRPIIDLALEKGVNCSTLFDMSHGAGILPKDWLEPVKGIRCGYAGGLSPDNVVQQIKLIESKVGEYELWIDMETQIRSHSDLQFDLTKVVSVLKSCVDTGLVITK